MWRLVVYLQRDNRDQRFSPPLVADHVLTHSLGMSLESGAMGFHEYLAIVAYWWHGWI
jgi:hypothetical protein